MRNLSLGIPAWEFDRHRFTAYHQSTLAIGNFAFRRSKNVSIFNLELDERSIQNAIRRVLDNGLNIEPSKEFGHGNSAKEFLSVLESDDFWKTKIQKFFRDR